MRTTMAIDDDLLRRAKREAVITGRTLGQVIEDALRENLSARPRRGTGSGSVS